MDASVLIVDDELHVCLLMTKILEQAGYICEQAENVQTAKQLLRQISFDLLLTDINMPGESGVELARYVKEHYLDTAVVMVTAVDDPVQAKEVLDMGVYGYLVKPFTKNLVLITVENALRRHRLEQQELANIQLLEEKVAERTRSLAEQLHLHQNLIDAIPVPVYYKGLDGKYLGCNRAFATALNIPRAGIIGKTVLELHAPVAAENLWGKDEELLRTGGVQVYEQTFPLADGSVSTGIVHKAAFRDIDGKISGLIGVRLDITELKQTEHALRASEGTLRSIMDNLQIGVVMIDPQMQLLGINRQVEHWFPQARNGVGKPCFQILSDQQDVGEICPTKEVFATGKSSEGTLRRQTAQGEKMFRVLVSPIYDETGTIVAALQLLEDVTEALVAERELRQAQKLEAVGQLAAGIAHEINTPVQYIGDNLRFLGDACQDVFDLQRQYETLLGKVKEQGAMPALIGEIEAAAQAADLPFLAEEIPKTLQQSLDGVSRVGKIVQAMREFSHPGTSEKSYVDINRALESTLTISRNEWKYVAEATTDLAPDLPPVLCLPGEMNQVFLNIIVNAAHAIGDVTEEGRKGKGTIGLATRALDDKVEIRISDSGGGVPEAVRHRIFDPFFTTKKVGKGTGQGLAIARSVVVDKHQGAIRFETETGRGTTFIIQLPIGEKQ